MHIALFVPDDPLFVPLTLIPILHNHAEITSGVYIMPERDALGRGPVRWFRNLAIWGPLGYVRCLTQSLQARLKSTIHRHSVFYSPATPGDIADYFGIPVKRIRLTDRDEIERELTSTQVQWIVHLSGSWAASTSFFFDLSQPVLHLVCGPDTNSSNYQGISNAIIQKTNTLEISVVETRANSTPKVIETQSITIDPGESWPTLERYCRAAGGALLSKAILNLKTE